VKKKIILKAPLLTRSGYGEQARFALRSLRSREDLFDIYILPLTWGHTSWMNDINPERQFIDECIEKTINYIQGGGQFDVSLQVTIPNEFEPMAPVNIGYTAGIETTRVAHQWIEKLNQMHRTIVVSNHSRDIFSGTVYEGTNEETGEKVTLKVQTPVEAVNYPVKTFENLEEVPLDLDYDFNFVCIAQMGPRKNLPNTLKWFVEEFHDEEIGLVLKTNMAKNCLMDREKLWWDLKHMLIEFPDRKCKIYLLHGDMTDEEMHALYVHPKIKAMIALPHGEGFGLPFFEAAYSGIPVVAPGWSGQMDFLVDEDGNERFYNVGFDILPVQEEVVWEGVIIKESGWAYPRESSAKQKMRECYNDVINDNIAWVAPYATELHERFSQERMYGKFVNSVVQALKDGGTVSPDWQGASTDLKADYIFVSDMFKEQYVGGAELSLEALISSCPSEKVIKINSQNLNTAMIDSNSDTTWIFGNIASLNPEITKHVIDSGINYHFVEFDYKFCEYRNPVLYERLEEEQCNYGETELGQLIERFVNGSQKTFFMSENQLNVYKKSLPKLDERKTTVLSSIFGDEFFETIEKIRTDKAIEKEDKWIVLGSRSWVKGSTESEEWCRERDLNYEVISDLSYQDVLKKLAASKGICFKPTALDTCPRFVIEAKSLGCELEINENVQHANEPWFNDASVEEMLDYLKGRRHEFWNVVAAVPEASNARAS